MTQHVDEERRADRGFLRSPRKEFVRKPAERTGELTAALLRGARIVTPVAVLTNAWLLVVDGRIHSLGSSADLPPAPAGQVDRPATDLAGLTILPGFIDLHLHGGGGHTFDDGTSAIRAGLATHRAHGTTRALVSLVTAPLPDMLRAVAQAADTDDPMILGLHLEGPFLAAARRGVHDPRALLAPDGLVLTKLLDAGRDRIRVVTLAPELPGGSGLIRQLTGAGVHPAVGHSDADYNQATAAFAAGADLVTHAFNGMRPLHHRDPAIVGAAMDAGVLIEVINDGIHLHTATVRLLHRIAPGRLVMVTDAMAAAGAADGDYRLGSYPVQVAGGVARLVGAQTLAGSTLTMDRALQRAVHEVGMDLVEAVNAVSLLPARFLGVADHFGSIEPGRVADLVITDPSLGVRAVMSAGAWVQGSAPSADRSGPPTVATGQTRNPGPG